MFTVFLFIFLVFLDTILQDVYLLVCLLCHIHFSEHTWHTLGKFFATNEDFYVEDIKLEHNEEGNI